MKGADIGSSPRAWGKFAMPPIYNQNHRFIPTCVGQMTAWKPAPPRLTGSSPRAWGNGLQALRVELLKRFIPTCVGQITRAMSLSMRSSGSSPRAWGKWLSRPGLLSGTTVHPHVRGANTKEFVVITGFLSVGPRLCLSQIALDLRTFRSETPVPYRSCTGAALRSLRVIADLLPQLFPHSRGKLSKRDSGSLPRRRRWSIPGSR